MTELVAGFQACSQKLSVEVTLWCMDALQCCDRGLRPDLAFDAINTSNLADNLELLNLLLVAGSRLKPDPHSR